MKTDPSPVPVPASSPPPPESTRVEDVRAVLDRYFFGLEPILRPIVLSALDLKEPSNPASVILTIKTVAERLSPVREALESACQRFAADDEKAVRATQALYLIEAGHKIDHASFHLPEHSLLAAKQTLEQSLEDRHRVVQKLEMVREELKSRLGSSLGLLETTQAKIKIESCLQIQDEVKRLVGFLESVASLFEDLDELRREQAALHLLLQYKLKGGAEAQGLCVQISEHLGKMLTRIQQATTRLPYPIGAKAGKMTVAQYLIGQSFSSAEPEAISREAAIVYGRMNLLYETVLAELVVIAEKVEAVF